MKNDNFFKILFLGVLIFAVFLGDSRYSRNFNQSNNLSNINNSIQSQKIIQSSIDKKLESETKQNEKPYIESQALNLLDNNKNNLNKPLTQSTLTSQETDFIFKYKNQTFIEPQISAEIALIADLKSGKIIWSKNENKLWPIASITKLITASYVLKNFDNKLKITLTEKDVNIPSAGTGNNQNLNAGEIYTVEDLVKWMLLASRNEAAMALANYFGYDQFIGGLNNLIKEAGVKNTNLVDPSGLSASNQATALDLVKIVKNIFEHQPQIFNLTTKKNLTVLDFFSNKKRTIINIHPFAGNSIFLGGKTGQTPLSKENLVSIFNIEKRPVLMLILGSDNRTEDTEKLLSWFKLNFQTVQK